MAHWRKMAWATGLSWKMDGQLQAIGGRCHGSSEGDGVATGHWWKVAGLIGGRSRGSSERDAVGLGRKWLCSMLFGSR